MAAPPGVEITGPMASGYDEVLTPEALELLAELHRKFDAGGGSCSRPPGPLRRSPPAARSTSCPRPQDVREDELAGRAAGARPGRPPGGDHRPDRPQDDDQRAELRRQGLAGRPRGRQHPAVGERGRAASSTCATRSTGTIDFTSPRARSTRSATTTSWPRSSSGRAAGTCRRSTCSSTASRRPAAWSTSRSTSSTARSGSSTRGQGPVLLPAEDGEPPRGAALERRVRPGAGPASASRAARSGPPC